MSESQADTSAIEMPQKPARTKEQVQSDILKYEQLSGRYNFQIACMEQDCERFYQLIFSTKKELQDLEAKEAAEKIAPESFIKAVE